MKALQLCAFITLLLAWGYRLSNVESDLGPSNPLMVCSKYVLYTSLAVTGDQSVEVPDNPDKDQYYITLMTQDEEQRCFDLEIGRADYEKTQAGNLWEYRSQAAGGFLFRPKQR